MGNKDIRKKTLEKAKRIVVNEEIPNTKHQIPNKYQCSKSKFPKEKISHVSVI
jgi:hypothetical protein